MTSYNLDGHVITDGPSREELFDALRLVGEGRQVTFNIVNHAAGKAFSLKAHILGIMMEAGIGHSWRLKVRFVSVPEMDIVLDEDGAIKMPLYNTRRCMGSI